MVFSSDIFYSYNIIQSWLSLSNKCKYFETRVNEINQKNYFFIVNDVLLDYIVHEINIRIGALNTVE